MLHHARDTAHRASSGRLLAGGLALTLALSVAACTPASGPPDDSTEPPASESESASPSPSPSTESGTTTPSSSPSAIDAPPPPDPTADEVARSVRSSDDAATGTGDTVVGTLAAGSAITVEGACSGEPASMPFTLASAAPDQEERQVLLEGSITCGTGVEADGFTYEFPYEGPVQVGIGSADGLDLGWVRVLQPAG